MFGPVKLLDVRIEFALKDVIVLLISAKAKLILKPLLPEETDAPQNLNCKILVQKYDN